MKTSFKNNKWCQRLIFESIDAAILLVDNNDKILYANDPFCDLMGGYKKGELLNQTANKMFLDPKGSKVIKKVIKYRKKKISGQYFLTVKNKTGQKLPLYICGFPVKDNKGKVIGSIGFHTRLNEIKSLKQKLKSALDDRNKLLLNIREAFFSVDTAKGKNIFLSDAHKEIYGYSNKEMRDNPNLWFEVIHPDDKSSTKEKVNLLSKGITIYDEHRIIRKDGKIIWVEAKVVPTLNKNGNLIRVDGIVSDISKRKKEERLKDEKIKDLNTFIYKTTHDLKSPLTNLEGLFNLACKEKNEDAKTKYREMMQQSVNRMKGMLNELTTIIESPYKAVNEDLIDFNEVIRDIKNEICHLPEFKEINISTEINIKNEFRTDRNLLLTILRNLVNNAIKYRSQKKPEIKISVSEDSRGVKIQVMDNGIGIPENYKEKIFEMFFRGTDASKGTGLGLYIAKNSAEKLFGKITVESKELSGTTFTVLLPDIKKYYLTHKPKIENT